MKQTAKQPDIVLNAFDARRLNTLILTTEKSHYNLAPWLIRLRRVLEQAHMVLPAQIDPDRVTMNSTFTLQNGRSQEKMNLSLIFPPALTDHIKPDSDEVNLSILTPLGLSVLGRRVGDWIAGRILIEKMIYQPEARNHFHL